MTEAETKLFELAVAGYPEDGKGLEYEAKLRAARAAVLEERLPSGTASELREVMFTAWDALERSRELRKLLPEPEQTIAKLHAEWKKLREVA